jgi:glucose/arabinose dehydrogenase
MLDGFALRDDTRATVLAAFALVLTACADAPDATSYATPRAQETGSYACDPDNGGLTLPAGFCAAVFADNLGAARHLTVRPNGDVYVAIANVGSTIGGIVALRDTDGDGHANLQARFGTNGGNGIAWIGTNTLYFAQNDRVVRYTINPGVLAPPGTGTVIVSGLPSVTEHVTKTITPLDAATMFLNIGSASNSCQVANRRPGSPGMDPCPELATRAGIWKFDPRVAGQSAASIQRYASGLRNTIALAVHPVGALFGVQMNRDNLWDNWPNLYSSDDDARLPAEELVRITQGADYGWPYCYYDGLQGQKVLAPEYGGDRVTVGRCASATNPVMALPAHWAPLAMTFYRGTLFPSRYRNGAFITFHGDYFWGTRPRSDSPGYNVVFVPFDAAGVPTGGYEVFADGFAGPGAVSRVTAKYRPTGVAQGPGGALFVADDVRGRVWRIVFGS